MRKLAVLILLMGLSTNARAAGQPSPEGLSSADWSQGSFVKKVERSDADTYNFVNSVLGEEESKTTTEVVKAREGNVVPDSGR